MYNEASILKCLDEYWLGEATFVIYIGKGKVGERVKHGKAKACT